MARIFLAIEVSEEVRAELVRAHATLERRLGDGVRLTRPEQLHLTLIFLGEIDDSAIAEVVAAARSCCRISPFGLTLGPPGVFPESGPATVVWVGVSDPTGALQSLVDSLGASVRRAGFSLEERRFVPHLTLGRCRNGDPRARAVAAELVVPPLPFRVSSLTVFRSERGQEGAEHTPVEVIRFWQGQG